MRPGADPNHITALLGLGATARSWDVKGKSQSFVIRAQNLDSIAHVVRSAKRRIARGVQLRFSSALPVVCRAAAGGAHSMAPQWAVGMTEQPDGSFKLSLLDDEPISSSPTSRSSLLAEPSAAASPLQEPPLPPPQQRLMIGLAAVGAFALTVILNHVSSLQHELIHMRRELKEEVTPLRSDLAALRGNVAALLSDKAALSAEQIAELLVLREASSCEPEVSEEAEPTEEDATNMLFTLLSLLVIFLLVLPPILLGAYEWRIGNAKSDFVGFNWHDQLAYRVDYWLSNYPAAKSAFLLMITGMLIVVGALMYLPADDETDALYQALWLSWCFVADPGTHADQDGGGGRLVAFAITIGGMLIFALMIGIVSDTISDRMDDLNKGLSRVMETDHTLLLGWSDKTIPTILELANAFESEGGGTIVILSENEKAEMEADVKERCGPWLRGTQVVCRSGYPIRVEDLRRVSAGTSKAIIVMADENVASADESDARVLRIMLSLTGLPDFVRSDAHAVVELCDLDNKELVHLVGGAKVETVVAHDVVGRLMIQCARQPGLGMVMESLLGFEGCEFYMSEWPELVGVTFGEISLRFADAIPIGIKTRKTARKDGKVHLNPPDDMVFGDGDELVVLAEDDDTYSPAEKIFDCSDKRPPVPAVQRQVAEEILFCGWRRDMHHTIIALDAMVAPQSTLHLMCDKKIVSDDVEDHPGMVDILAEFIHGSNLSEWYEQAGTPRSKNELGEDLPRLRNLTLNFITGMHTQRKELETLPLEKYDSVLILATEDSECDMETTDSESLACLLRIRDIVSRRHREAETPEDERPKQDLISEILDSRTKDLVDMLGGAGDERVGRVMSNSLISAALAMISENREVNGILAELLSAEGDEAYVRDAKRYVHDGEKASFYTVMRRAR